MFDLYIGNKNYSSWSLRAWLAMTHYGIPFREIRLRLFSESFYREIAKVSPAGRVPVLLEDGFAVWDTLAIYEYLAERFSDMRLWPEDAKDRARARSICAEMHAGFTTLRSQMGMNIEASLPGRGWNVTVQKDIDRIVSMWSGLLGQHGGPFLFGPFTLADSYFAPVCTRFRTYQPALPAQIMAYVDRVFGLPAMQKWVAEALEEHEFIVEDEPYRIAP
jgi:glutathione S-transferase